MRFELFYLSNDNINRIKFKAYSIKEMKEIVDSIIHSENAMYIGCEYIGG